MPYFEHDGERLYYEEAGKGPALVFLHSLGTSGRALWADQAAAFSDRYRVITPDHRGHGRSSHRRPMSLDGIAGDLVALLDHLGVDRARWVGLSMGGCWLLSLYARHPERMAAMVLADTFASVADPAARLRDREVQLAATSMAEFGQGYAQNALGPEVAPAVRRRVAAAIGDVTREAYIDTMRTVFTVQLDEVLGTVRLPTLVLVGEHDAGTPPAVAEHLARRIPGAELVQIAGAGHLSNLDNPAEFNQALADFLARADGMA